MNTAQPPMAKKHSHPVTLHGDTRQDDYFWLRDKTNPEVIKHLEEENAYTELMMADTKPLQEKLFAELKSRIKETDQSAPGRNNGYQYYSRTEAGKQYSTYCRRKGDMKGAEEVLVDMNQLAEGKKFLALRAYSVSPNAQLLAYGLDYDGSRKITMYIKDLQTGKILDEFGVMGGAFAWANDNKTVFYNIYDEALRSYKIFRHVLGTPKTEDVEIFHEKDDKFDVYVGKTRSAKYITMTVASKLTREVWLLDADNPSGQFAVVEPRKTGHEYSVEHQGNRFLILTNDNAVNFRLMEAPVTPNATPSQATWKEIVAHRPTVKLEDVDAFDKFFVLTERDAGLIKFRITNDKPAVSGNESHYIQFPEQSYIAGLGANADYTTPTLRYIYESLTTPETYYDYDMTARTQVLVKRQEVPNYNPDNYVSERIYATASDGVKIPMSIVYKKGIKKSGANPTFLYGYGSYGIPNDPDFRASRLIFLERGFVYAIAHIRGGGDMGKQWYEDGKFLKKKNTFTDFIACAEHLVKEKYTKPEKLVIEGRSAGGLLMGAVTNMRPDLFKAVHYGVPFVDVINTMTDATLPLTTGEYEEWGNPNDKQYYDYMKSYAPYENVEKKKYPIILMTTGLNDSQVPYWEPTKMAAKLREMKTDKNMLIMKVNMGVGHGGASGRYDALKDRAFETAFFLKALGISK